MKQKIAKKILLLGLGMILTSGIFGISAVTTHAQAPGQTGSYTTLAPLPGTTDCGTNVSGSNPCKTTFQSYLPNIFNLAIGIAAALAFIMISWGGFRLMTTDSIQGKTEGREKVTQAIYGLILVLGAYAILYTINPQLLQFNLNIGALSYTNLPTGVSSDATASTISGIDLTNDAANRTALENAGVTVQSAACTGTNTKNCVNVNGLKPDTISGVEALQSACGVAKCVVISGGSEDGHTVNSDHAKGTALDIPANSNLNDTIRGNDSPAPCATYTKTIGGVTGKYLWEPKDQTCGGSVPSSGDHWHVVYQ